MGGAGHGAGYGTQTEPWPSTSRTSPRTTTTPAPTRRTPGACVAIEAALERAGWLGLERVEAPAASREQLERVHAPGHITRDRGVLRGRRRDDRPRHGRLSRAPTRPRCTRRAAPPTPPSGCSRAMRGSAICALRPPGHHAERDRAMGFCLFNNVAVAAAARDRRLRRGPRAGARLGRPSRQRDRGDLRCDRRACSTRASISGRSTRARGPRSSRARGRGRASTSTCRSRPERARRSSWRWSSTSWCRSPAHTSPA